MNKVLHYKCGSYLPITENWIYGQICFLKKYKPIIYCHGKENLDVYPTDRVRSFPRIKNEAWDRINSFHILAPFCLLRDRPSLIHSHFGPSGYMFLKQKNIFNLPMVTTFYGYDLSMLPACSPIWKKRYETLFEEGEYFLAEGAHMKRCLMKLGCPESKVIIQHLGVNLDKIKFVPRIIQNNEEIKILIAGSFREKKGIPNAIEAFGKVKEENPALRLRLSIIGGSGGGSREESEKQRILEKIKELGLGESINMLGYKSHDFFLKELYKNHIFLSPSITASDGDTEGGAPVSIIEASASGMPVLSTLHCDIPEVILDKETGFLVPEKNVESLKEKLEILIANPHLWGDMGLRARKHVEENYDINKQSQKLEKIYDSVARKT